MQIGKVYIIYSKRGWFTKLVVISSVFLGISFIWILTMSIFVAVFFEHIRNHLTHFFDLSARPCSGARFIHALYVKIFLL